MENQSLFKNEPDTKPLGKKLVVKRKEIPKLEKIERRKTEYDAEIDQLFSVCRNRTFLEEAFAVEQEMVFYELSKAVTKTGRSLKIIVAATEKLLKEKPNLYVIQAIKFVIKEWR